jgi:hypothetical protein
MARTEGQWQKKGAYLIPADDVPVVLKNDYLNFGGLIPGDLGYGIRNNGGTIEIKNSGGAWAIPSTGGGEANTGSNLGTGSKVFKQKVGVGFQYRTLVAGSGVTLVEGTNEITISSTGGGGSGEANTASNVGTDGLGVFKQKTGVDLEFKNIAPASSKVTVVANGDDIDIDVDPGEINTGDLNDDGTFAAASHTHTKSEITDFSDGDYATAVQGTKADSAIQAADLSAVATSGDYDDLSNKPDLSVYDSFDQYADLASFPATGDADVVYVAQDTGYIYRWTGSTYAQMSAELALGETSSTAYRGDRGKVAYDHTSVTSGNPHNVTKSDVGLGSVPNTDFTAAVAANTAKVSATTENVRAAGGVMDDEITNLAQVKTFDSSDYATAAQGATADSAMQDFSDDTSPSAGGELDMGANSIGFTMQTATGDGTTTVDWGAGNHMDFTFGAFNETFTFTAPAKPGVYTMSLKQDGIGSRTATWPATVKWPAGTAPTLTTTATTGYDVISFRFDGTNYYAIATLDFS